MKPVRRFRGKSNGTTPVLRLILPLLGGAVLVLGIWIGVFFESRDVSGKSPETTPILFSVPTMEVSRQFACPCGSCDEENLTICECSTALSVKRFIEGHLNDGLRQMEVIEKVKSVYGHYYKG